MLVYHYKSGCVIAHTETVYTAYIGGQSTNLCDVLQIVDDLEIVDVCRVERKEDCMFTKTANKQPLKG